MTDTKRAVQYLTGDPLLHMDMLECIRGGHARLLEVSDAGVLLANPKTENYMMSTEDKTAAIRMIAAVPAAGAFVAHQAFYVQTLRQKFGFRVDMPCLQAAYLKKTPLPPADPVIDIRPLGEEHLSFIMEHYSHADDEAYHLERLKAGVMFGAFIDDALAGFIGTHGEGSLGMLEVLPRYRRRGVARALETYAANRMLAQGKIPFAQIIVGNTPSLELHRKLQFAISENTLHWLS